MEMGACVPVSVVRLTRSRNAAGEMVVRLGVPLLDEYLEFLAGRCGPNTVLAVAEPGRQASCACPPFGGYWRDLWRGRECHFRRSWLPMFASRERARPTRKYIDMKRERPKAAADGRIVDPGDFEATFQEHFLPVYRRGRPARVEADRGLLHRVNLLHWPEVPPPFASKTRLPNAEESDLSRSLAVGPLAAVVGDWAGESAQAAASWEPGGAASCGHRAGPGRPVLAWPGGRFAPGRAGLRAR